MTSSIEPAVTGPRSLRDPRSREYAIQTMRSLKRFLEGKSLDAQGVARELQEIRQYRHWEARGFKTLDAYLKSEVGTTLKQLERRLAQDLAADPTVTALANPGRPIAGSSNVADRHINTLSSESAERIVRRLKRDHPEIAAALARGEFKSARAAAIAAGIVKPRLRRCPQCGHEW
jgi:hypothetical protein